MATEEKGRDLECLSGDALARIVEADMEVHGDIKGRQAIIAFEVLESRTPGLDL